jgi:hypothetical protein
VRTVINALAFVTCDLALILALAAGRPIVALAQNADVYHPAGEENPVSGKQDFMNHCAPCHGDNGKGNGPELKVLPDIHPSDLTNITLKNGGVFPTQKVADMIDGRKSVPSHSRKAKNLHPRVRPARKRASMRWSRTSSRFSATSHVRSEGRSIGAEHFCARVRQDR